MGRKSQSKQNSKKSNKQTKQKDQTGTENNKFVIQKRKELLVVVDKLFRLTSTFQTSPKLSKTWDHHLEIVKIIKEINIIECSFIKQSAQNPRQSNIANFIKWMKDNEAHFDGIEIAEFEGYDLGLKATENFIEDSLILTVPRKVMISEKDARDSELADFIAVDPLLQNMPNIMLALFLLLEKNKTDSFWKPYIDILPEKYTTVLYFTEDEISDLRPSPVFESSLKLYRSIARQYAYFYIKIHTLDIPALQNLRSVFTYDNYRWAVSTVMTRQNNLRLSDSDTTAFIPLWDMCNHEHGKMTTDFNKELNRAECYALRNFQAGEQVFIFYGARPNADLFLHNGFVYPKNQHDSVSLGLGISTGDPLRPAKLALLAKLGLAGVTHYHVYRGDHPISAELLAFIRIFNMNEEELQRWSSLSLPGELVAGGAAGAAAAGAAAAGAALERRAHQYLATRCRLVRAAYAQHADDTPDTAHRRNIKLLKECKVQILDGAIKYLENILQKLPTLNE